MAVSFRQGVALSSTPTNPQTLDPGTDPSTGDILIVPAATSNTSGAPTLTGNGITTNGMGGTWTTEKLQGWAGRRLLRVEVNDDWTTPTGTVAVSFTGNQDRATGMVIVSGASSYTTDASAGDVSGSDWTPTLAAGHDGHIVVIQMEDDVTIGTPSGWTSLAQVTDADGLRSLAVFTIAGEPPDLTPTFSFGTSNGYTAWSAYFDAEGGAASTSHVPRRRRLALRYR